MFKVFTMINGHVIDFNYRFGVIGIYRKPTLLYAAKAYIAPDKSS